MKKKTVLFGFIAAAIIIASSSIAAAEIDPVDKYALIIGVSDYEVINDLSYCDEDATDWYNYLAPLGYQITLLGDSQAQNFPQYDGLATEYNVKNAWASIVAQADENDIIVWASSGHGAEVNIGGRRRKDRIYVQVLCMWDTSSGENGEDGLIYDSELQAMMAPAVSNVFIFLDHCNSGGMNEVMLNANANKIYMATTCTADGYGYDDPTHLNGAWTYYFLEHTLIGVYGGTASMEATFAYASSVYPFSGDDTPMEFDGNTGVDFYL
ncbi:caspase family protein [Candidatus Heimdallarchaeota archaeon]|nr:MAG: caspase family protein [Candidatus Heimdallarchaeota archaeon]